MPLIYRTGDATSFTERPAFLLHIVNNIGAFGAGFTASLNKKWSIARESYNDHVHQARKSKEGLNSLGGTVLQTRLEDHLWLMQMFAQDGVRSFFNKTPLRYDWLDSCLIRVNNYAAGNGIKTIVCPRLGAGLAGGNWEQISRLLEHNFCEYYKDKDVIVYTLEE